MPTGSPSAAIPALAQGDRVTRCPHGAIPALNNSWHCWPQASCPEEEKWLWRGRQCERENHHDLGTSSVLCRLLPGSPSAHEMPAQRPQLGDGGDEDPAQSPLPVTPLNGGMGRRPRWDWEHLGSPSQVTCDSIIGKTTFIGVT